MGEMTFPCSLRNMSKTADETQHVQKRRTLSAVHLRTHTTALCLCAWRSGGFGFTHAHFRLLKLDLMTPNGLGVLQQATAVTRSFCSTQLWGVYAHECAHAGFIWAAVRQNIRILVTNGQLYKLLTCEATYRSPAPQVCSCAREGGYEEAVGSAESSLHNSVGRRHKTVEIPIRWV